MEDSKPGSRDFHMLFLVVADNAEPKFALFQLQWLARYLGKL